MALLSTVKNTLRYMGDMGLLGDTARKGESAYYSAVVEGLHNLPQKKGTKTQIINALKKQPNVKDEEIKFLELGGKYGPDDIVTVDELLDDAYTKLPRVERSKYGIGGLKPRKELEKIYAERVRDQQSYDYNDLNTMLRNEQMENYRIGQEDLPDGSTEWTLYDQDVKVETYDNYRDASDHADSLASEWADKEIMKMSDDDIINYLNPSFDRITNDIPRDELFVKSEIEPLGMGDPTFQAYSQQGGYGPEYRENVLNLDYGTNAEGRQEVGMMTQGIDTTTHFPSDPNYLMHTRGSEVTVEGAGGQTKGYLLDEIQSDLHQFARKNQARGKRGYQYGEMTLEQKQRAADKLDELSALKIESATKTKKLLDGVRDKTWDTVDQFASTNPEVGDKVFVPMTDRGADGPESMFVVVGKDSDGKPYFDHAIVDRSKDTYNNVEQILEKRMQDYETYGLDTLQTGFRPVTFMNSTSASPQLRGPTAAGNRIHRSTDPALQPDDRFFKTGNDSWLKQDYLTGAINEVKLNDSGLRFDVSYASKDYREALENVTREDFGLDPIPEFKELREAMGDDFVDSGYELTKGIDPIELDRMTQQYGVNKSVEGLSGPEAIDRFSMFRDNLEYVPDEILAELQDRVRAERGGTYFENVPNRAMPNFPFENTYSGLGIKEGILEAIQQDADYMVLPDPVDQAARYNMLESKGGEGLQRHYSNLATNKAFKQLGLKPEPRTVQLFDREGNYIDKELMTVPLPKEYKEKVASEGLPFFSLAVPSGYAGYKYLSNVAPEPVEQPRGLLDDLIAYPAELNSGLVEGLAGAVDFLIPDTINAVSELSGSDFRVPRLSDQPEVQYWTQGGYVENPYAREATRFAGSLLSPL